MQLWIEGYPVVVTQLSSDDLNTLQNHYLPKCLDIKDADAGANGFQNFAKNKSQRWSKDKAFFNKWNETLEPYVRRYVESFNFQFPWEMSIDTWYNVHGKYGFQQLHDHITTNCPAFSCAVILKQPNPDAGQFVFPTPRFSKHLKYLELDPMDQYKNTYQPPMFDGAMIIFPSCLDHYVTQNMTDELRVVFASNIVVKRTSSLF